ncbi:hypothetical protein BU14_0171s0009 [Porphyra umbilicalis]|uniref:EGF domain-specific O-linked N-acetylglucosamine transferase n=1 Tax=Porphyra umbilicalis TaxID=2786 RepID=A0A1X6P7X4_PORUM|nr:hypothetical protein BU14_0171s0009 [Porphyra umbilicalis]|eukprot:OSX76860.1 hypothetical protein BU14_0171s0009 [Porphyra umbilicalis]
MGAHHTWVGRCGIRRPLYVLGTPAEAGLSLIRASRYAALDLLSPAPARTHMPHFLSDAIGSLVLMDLLGGSRWDAPAASYYCNTAAGGGGCDAAAAAAPANVALYLERAAFNSSWVAAFARLMAKAADAPPRPPPPPPPDGGGGAAGGDAAATAAAAAAAAAVTRPITGVTYLDRERVFALGDAVGDGAKPTAVCYRSLLSTAHVFWRMPRAAVGDANPFFAAARLPRTTRLQAEAAAVTAAGAAAHAAATSAGDGAGAADAAAAAAMTAAAAAAAAAPCTITVTLNSRAGQRRLTQTAQLGAAITALAAGHNHFFAPPRVAVRVTEAHFEGMPFAAQQAAMRATDVLVASHGAGLTNMVFLRPGSAVLEVYPFAYTAELFAQMADFLGLAHTAVVAAPDGPAYKACLANYNGAADAFAKGGALPPPLAAAFAEWDAAVAGGNTGPGRLRLERADNDGPVRRRRWCVRWQSLSVDVPAVAKAAWERGLALCAARGSGAPPPQAQPPPPPPPPPPSPAGAAAATASAPSAAAAGAPPVPAHPPAAAAAADAAAPDGGGGGDGGSGDGDSGGGGGGGDGGAAAGAPAGAAADEGEAVAAGGTAPAGGDAGGGAPDAAAAVAPASMTSYVADAHAAGD